MAGLPTLADLQDLGDLAAAADGPHLATPRIKVVLDDGRVLVTQARNPDYLRWDRTAAKHGWPAITKAPFLWITFVAWSALRREGQIPDAMTWEEFSEQRALEVTPAREPENGEAADAHPTPPGAGPG